MGAKMSSRHPSTHELSAPENTWDKAITDAERMLKKTQDKARQLEQAIRIFKKRKQSGEPFFGENSEPSEAKSDAAQ
jgi:hypothetical protein